MVSMLAPTSSTPSLAAIATASYSGMISEAEADPSYPGSPTSLDNESAQTNVIPMKKSILHSSSSILVHTTENPPFSIPTPPSKERALVATTTTSPAEDLHQRSLPGQFGAPAANPAPTLNSPIQSVIVMVKNTAAATGAWLSGAARRFFEETGNRRGLAEAELRVGAGA